MKGDNNNTPSAEEGQQGYVVLEGVDVVLGGGGGRCIEIVCIYLGGGVTAPYMGLELDDTGDRGIGQHQDPGGRGLTTNTTMSVILDRGGGEYCFSQRCHS